MKTFILLLIVSITLIYNGSFSQEVQVYPLSSFELQNKEKKGSSEVTSAGIKLIQYGIMHSVNVLKEISEYKISATYPNPSSYSGRDFNLYITYDDGTEEVYNSSSKKGEKNAEFIITPKYWKERKVYKLRLNHGQSGAEVLITKIEIKVFNDAVSMSGSKLNGTVLVENGNLRDDILIISNGMKKEPYLTNIKGKTITFVCGKGTPYDWAMDKEHTFIMYAKDAKNNRIKMYEKKILSKVEKFSFDISGLDLSKVDKLTFSGAANSVVWGIRQIIIEE
jgi:hypothetical protein